MNRLVLPVVLLIAGILLVTLPAEAPGCGVAPREGDRVYVADESALIVWDAATKTEHFIRRASFEATAYDFGFLVPTPNRPQLEEASGSLFSDLANLTAAKVVYKTQEVKQEIDFGCAKRAAPGDAQSMAGGKAAAPGGFEVLEQTRVGDLDAAVLGFRPGEGDPDAASADLLKWLGDHGYAVHADLKEWITIYARQKWVITAFKMASTAPGGPPAPTATPPAKDTERPRRPVTMNSTTVRMSFQAERPFFPYREPAGQRTDPGTRGRRFLRVYIAAKERMAGKLGDTSAAWAGNTVWADAVPQATQNGVFAKAKMPLGTTTEGWWLTEFEDHSFPRPGTDEVYFEPAADQSPVARPPLVVTRYTTVRVYPEWFGPVAILVPFTLLVAGLLLIRRMSR